MANLMDSLKSSLKSEHDNEDTQATLDNLNKTMVVLSKSLLDDAMSNPNSYTAKDLKDISSIISNLNQDVGNTQGTGTPASPQAINVYFNKNLEGTGKISFEDNKSDISQGLDELSEEEVSKLIEDTNNIQNQENYNENQD